MSRDQSNTQQEQSPGAPDTMSSELPADEHPGGEKVIAALTKAMPWVISLLFHLGLFLIMVFVVFVMLHEKQAEEIIIPDAVMSNDPGGRMTISDDYMKAVKTSRVSQKRKFIRKGEVTVDTGKTAKPLDIIGLGGGASADAVQMGMTTVAGGGPKSSFFGSGGNAYNVVYVVDRSGSMVDTFNDVRREMLRSIGRLRKTQMFHVILFGEDKPIENRLKKLVPATRANKKEAARFLDGVITETLEETDPIPALNRAFDVLRDARKRGRLIYLLTDGEFSDSEKVLRAIRAKNPSKKKRVYINTFLYGTKPPEAVDVMKRIAQENGGRYTFVPYDQ